MRTWYRFAVVFPECNSRQICELLLYVGKLFEGSVRADVHNGKRSCQSPCRDTAMALAYAVRSSWNYPVAIHFALSLRASFSFLPLRGRRRGNKRKTSLPSSGLINLRGRCRNLDLLLILLLILYDFTTNFIRFYY